MTWSNTAHITQADWDDHQASLDRKRLQKRIYDIKTARKDDPQVHAVYVEDDIMDILQAVVDESVARMEDEDEDDKS